MKALKEKRISLRSLWRRGLVILSLFALVFASCSESDNGDDTGSGGKRVTSIAWYKEDGKDLKPPTYQYLGQRMNLTGAALLVTYSDGTTARVDAPKLGAIPEKVTGYFDAENEFHPSTYYAVLFYTEDEVQFIDGWDIEVVGLLRQDTSDNEGPDLITTDPDDPDAKGIRGSYANSVELTGIEKFREKTYYVDDTVDKNDLNVLSLGAWYTDGSYWPLSFDDVEVRIVPQYPKAPNTEVPKDPPYPGYLYITVGKDDSAEARAAKYNGVTKMVALKEVYTVTSIEFATKPELEMLFWEPNTDTAWYNRLVAKNAELVINYTGGAEATKTKKISELRKNRIWYNANPDFGDDWELERDPANIHADFYVSPILNSDFSDAKKTPEIILYYRGAELKLGVDVYTILRGLTTAKAGGGEIEFDTTIYRGQDNDVTYGPTLGVADLAKLLEVDATYRTYHDKEKEKPFRLAYQATATHDGAFFTIIDYPNQTTLDGWKDGSMHRVTVQHDYTVTAVKAKLQAGLPAGTTLSPDALNGVVATGEKTAKQNVTWIIPK